MKRIFGFLTALAMILCCICSAGFAEEPAVKHVENLIIGTTAANNTFNMTTQADAFGRMNYNGLTQGNYVYRDANGDVGAFQNSFAVDGRGGAACVRCGRPLEKIRVAGRATVFCPHCQK